mgnify:CR=1 FL=1
MNPTVAAFIGLTVMVAGLVGLLLFAGVPTLLGIMARARFPDIAPTSNLALPMIFMHGLPPLAGAVALIDQAIVNEAHDLGMVVPNRKREETGGGGHGDDDDGDDDHEEGDDD